VGADTGHLRAGAAPLGTIRGAEAVRTHAGALIARRRGLPGGSRGGFCGASAVHPDQIAIDALCVAT